MKKLLLLALSSTLFAGCANVTVVRQNGTNVTFHASTFLSNTALKNLNLDGTTKTTSSLLKMSGATTEPNPEAITATGESLGNVIGAAIATAVKKP